LAEDRIIDDEQTLAQKRAEAEAKMWPADVPFVSLRDQIREVGREIGQRKAVYPYFVAQGRYTVDEALRYANAMRAAYRTLKWVEKHQGQTVTIPVARDQ
jgi:hypothetical protein